MFRDRNTSLLIVSPEQKTAVRSAALMLNEEQIQDSVDVIVKWFKDQIHLPRIQPDRDVIERILISRKGSIEKTKRRIDMMYTVRTLVPELAEPRDILHPKIQGNFTGMIFTPLPRLNHDNTRINLYRYTTDIDNYNFQNFLNYLFMSIEYRIKCDYATGDRSLIDFQHRSLEHITKENPGMIKNCEVFIRKAYGIRLLGLHVINAPSFLNSIINVVKRGLSEKLNSRLHIHTDYHDLYKFIDQDILPVEYGGNEVTALELVDEWKKEFAKPSIRQYLKQQEALRSDESKRDGSFNAALLGISATFKSLEFD